MKLKSLTLRVERLERAAAESKRNTGEIVERTLRHIFIKAGATALTPQELMNLIDDCKKSRDFRLSDEFIGRIIEQGNAISRKFSGKNWEELLSLSHEQLELLLRSLGITNVAQITRIV